MWKHFDGHDITDDYRRGSLRKALQTSEEISKKLLGLYRTISILHYKTTFSSSEISAFSSVFSENSALFACLVDIHLARKYAPQNILENVSILSRDHFHQFFP